MEDNLIGIYINFCEEGYTIITLYIKCKGYLVVNWTIKINMFICDRGIYIIAIVKREVYYIIIKLVGIGYIYIYEYKIIRSLIFIILYLTGVFISYVTICVSLIWIMKKLKRWLN